jgi:alkanesulfonate monooxygenase SsuD/methylene tetrahydromethanopterin reductase-like flavin-dependent oxidoreductase (luciferase family)
MSQKSFRFGVVSTAQDGLERWLKLARTVESLGYTTLLTPDGPALPSPWATLAVAASATSVLRVGTFVLAAPLRAPRLAAWDAHTLSVMTGGRFELGIATGRPEVAEQAVELFGMPRLTPAGRLGLVEQTIAELRALDGDVPTPVMIAAGGPHAQRLAARVADIVAIPAGALANRDEVARTIAHIRELAGERGDTIELSMNIFAVGDEVSPWVLRFLQTDASAMIKADSLAMVRGGSLTDMADEIKRRRDTFGVSYVTVNAACYEQFAPIAEKLTGT